MTSQLIVREDHERDAAFSQVLHGRSATQKSALTAMLSKDSKAQAAVADAYFRHWDNKDAKIETKEDREVSQLSFSSNPYLRKSPSEPDRGLRKHHSKV